VFPFKGFLKIFGIKQPKFILRQSKGFLIKIEPFKFSFVAEKWTGSFKKFWKNILFEISLNMKHFEHHLSSSFSFKGWLQSFKSSGHQMSFPASR